MPGAQSCLLSNKPTASEHVCSSSRKVTPAPFARTASSSSWWFCRERAGIITANKQKHTWGLNLTGWLKGGRKAQFVSNSSSTLQVRKRARPYSHDFCPTIHKRDWVPTISRWQKSVKMFCFVFSFQSSVLPPKLWGLWTFNSWLVQCERSAGQC